MRCAASSMDPTGKPLTPYSICCFRPPPAIKRRTHVQHLHAAQTLRYAHNALHSVMSDERLPLTRLSNSSADVGLWKLPT